MDREKVRELNPSNDEVFNWVLVEIPVDRERERERERERNLTLPQFSHMGLKF